LLALVPPSTDARRQTDPARPPPTADPAAVARALPPGRPDACRRRSGPVPR